MSKKLILRLSNGIGNQMFMYASAYSISKKLNRELLLDNETAFLSKKNISKFGLDNFNIKANICAEEYKFKNFQGYIKRKFFKKIDFLRFKKKFYIEKKIKLKLQTIVTNIYVKTFLMLLLWKATLRAINILMILNQKY